MPPAYKSTCTKRFWKLYDELPPEIQAQAKDAYKQFAANPLSSGLNFEQLKSRPELYSVRVTKQYRAVGRVSGGQIVWAWIGTHNEFDKMF